MTCALKKKEMIIIITIVEDYGAVTRTGVLCVVCRRRLRVPGEPVRAGGELGRGLHPQVSLRGGRHRQDQMPGLVSAVFFPHFFGA